LSMDSLSSLVRRITIVWFQRTEMALKYNKPFFIRARGRGLL
jgi:hypothetical protein